MKKKLLIYAHYYYPDVASTGQILQELAEGLKERFEITVICTVPSYTGTIEEKYKSKKFYFEEIGGVKVIRIRVPEFSKSDKLSRIKNILAYYTGAKKATKMAGKQDYVFTISQPPVLGGMLGVYGKKKCKAKFVYNIQDFNPEQIEAVGYSKLKPVLSVMKSVDKRSCRAADKVIVVGRDMAETLKKRFEGTPMPEFCVINNWIDEEKIYPLPQNDEKVNAFKEKYGLQNKFVVMYSGNLGLYYDLENLIRLAEPYKTDKDVVFAFVGQGSVEEKLKSYVAEKGLENVIFIPYQPKEDLNFSLNGADVHWVVNAQGIKGVSVPSKLYGVMAAGKPVLGVLEEGSEARMIIEESGCGLVAAPGDYDAIAEMLAKFIRREANISGMGTAGRNFLVKHLTKDISIGRYAEEIEKL
jgi:glycosyltransferase involved in cell wall biosynthesis